jgi:tRNA pseudouridine55 synthase
MARKGADKVDGWLILDKPAGISSTAALGRARRALNAGKAGHAGTLDPLATGVLVLAFGEATKLISMVIETDKAYRFTVRWGEARDTDDAEGQVIATSPHRPQRAEIEAGLAAFRGPIVQVPPDYSAVKLQGKPAYARRRAGEAVEITPRQVRIDRFELEDIPYPDHATFMVQCSKGTYIRSLARDLAASLGGCGHVTALRRLAVGRFAEADAIPLEKLEASGHSPAALAYLRAVETALDDIPALAVTAADSLRLRQGQSIAIPRTAETPVDRDAGSPLAAGQVVAATALGRLVALTRIEGDRLHPLRVLNLEPGPAAQNGATSDVDYG